MEQVQEFESKVEETGELLQSLKTRLRELEEEADEVQDFQYRKLAEKIDVETSDVDIEDLKEFLKKPYLVNEAGEDQYQIIVPAFLDFQVGRLDRQVNNYNVFIVDKYTKWMHGVPEFLKDEIDLDDESRFKVLGDVLEYEEGEKDRVESDPDISKHVEDVGDRKATIKQGSEFELLAELIEKGELPFTPQPVDDEDLREPDVNFELRDYQRKGFNRFMQEGHACFCWMTGAGKSFPIMYALDSLMYDEDDARKAVVCQSRLTKQQWNEYFEEFAPRLVDEVELVTYQSIDKLDGDYVLVAYDEAHTLPADTFAKGATIPTKYRIGATASPYREDGRQNYVFALTGPPVGLDWEKTLDLMGKTFHKVNIHIVDDRREKIRRVQDILDEVGDKKALIFCDGLDFGEDISDKTGIEFVSGEDKKQLEKINEELDEHGRVAVSRIGDHGFSRDDLEVAIEADFLYGSRRQQIQRTGRLFHGEGKRHDILFTRGEFNKYQKRLFSLIEKGFELNFVDREEEIEIPEKYEGHVNLDIEVEDPTESGGRSVGDQDFLKHPKVREEIEDAIESADNVSDETLKEVLLEIDLSEDGLTNDEIAEILGAQRSNSYRLTKCYREHVPPLLIQDDEGVNRFNTDLLEEMKKREQREKKREERRRQLEW